MIIKQSSFSYFILKSIYLKIKFILYKMYQLKLLPLDFFPIIVRRDIINHSFFIYKRKLVDTNNGYWRLEPKLTSLELNDYYSKLYYKHHRSKIDKNITPRDLDQFILIKEKILDLNKTKSYNIINFGSGYSGISYLFMILGHNVVNIDPAIEDNDGFGIKTIKQIENYNGKADLFFSSHSLEHVTDLNLFFYELYKILKDGSYLFFEVPNCEHKHKNGGINGKIIPPHTYYFKLSYFENLKFKTLENKLYSQKKTPHLVDKEGEVIRYIGRNEL